MTRKELVKKVRKWEHRWCCGGWLWYSKSKCKAKTFEYNRRLQKANIHHCLTGEELTIK